MPFILEGVGEGGVDGGILGEVVYGDVGFDRCCERVC